MKVIGIIVDELPAEPEHCPLITYNFEGVPCCGLSGCYCHLLDTDRCPIMIKAYKESED